VAERGFLCAVACVSAVASSEVLAICCDPCVDTVVCGVAWDGVVVVCSGVVTGCCDVEGVAFTVPVTVPTTDDWVASSPARVPVVAGEVLVVCVEVDVDPLRSSVVPCPSNNT